MDEMSRRNLAYQVADLNIALSESPSRFLLAAKAAIYLLTGIAAVGMAILSI